MKKISKAKNSFVAHAIVVAVSLFLVAFSLSAPGVAFAEDIKVQSSEPTQTVIDQPAVVAEATPAVEAVSVPSDPAQVSGVEAVPGNSSTQKSEGASSALDTNKNTNVENSASNPAASSDSNATEFSTTQVEEKATISERGPILPIALIFLSRFSIKDQNSPMDMRSVIATLCPSFAPWAIRMLALLLAI